MRFAQLVFTLGLVVCLGACSGSSESDSTETAAPADLIFHNGKVFTAREDHAFAQAVAISEGTIVAVGQSEDVLRLAGPETDIEDLEGRTLLPGFFDNHIHLGPDRSGLQPWAGGLIADVPDWIRGVETLPELQEALRQRAAATPEGEWILGALSREVWPNHALPTRQDLDAGSTEHPISLSRGPHTDILNSRALVLAGISGTTVSPGGGEIGMRDDGEPNGRLFDAARRLADDARPAEVGGPVDFEAGLEVMRRTLLDLASLGVSSVNIAGTEPAGIQQVQALYERYGTQLPRATLQVRLRPGFDNYDDLDRAVSETLAQLDELDRLGLVTGVGDDRLRMGAIKMSIDGGLSAPAIWSLEAYESRPDFAGVIRIPSESFYPVARRAHELGWQLGIHAMGDAAVQMVVEDLARILEESPRENHRHYLHHVVVRPPQETIETMARWGIGVASQPAFTVGLGSFAVEALSGEREARMNPTRSLLEAGVWVSWGSDGAPYGPRVALWTGITRKGWDGAVYGPEEAVGREEAVRLHTWAPAFQTFSDSRKGTIEVGKLADFVILGEDIFTIDEDRIRHVPILKTLVGGVEIYRRPEE